jgi:hypothetical protein
MREPFVGCHSRRLVVGGKDTALFGRVTEDHGVGRFLGKDVDRPLNIPPSENELIEAL